MVSKTGGRRVTDPYDKIRASLIEAVDRQLHDRRQDAEAMTDSPIEAVLLTSVLLAAWDEHDARHLGIPLVWRGAGQPLDSALNIITQAQIGSYRVDFLILVRCKDGGWRRLVIECDGPDFHERTKEQAARDRARDRTLTAAGYEVFRFTGSEIHRDPTACADQVVAWAVNAVAGERLIA
jgi:very-short-patch-repair endonuclease